MIIRFFTTYKPKFANLEGFRNLQGLISGFSIIKRWMFNTSDSHKTLFKDDTSAYLKLVRMKLEFTCSQCKIQDKFKPVTATRG